MVFVSSSEIAKEIFKNNESSFSNRPANIAINYLTYNSSDLAFAPYGTYWKFMKKLCMSEFLNGKMLDQLLPIRKDEINRFLQMIVKKSEANEAVNVTDELLKLTNSIVMRMSIGKSCFKEDDEAHKVTERVKESAMVSGMFNLADYFWFCKRLDMQGIKKRLKDVHGRFDNMMESIIKEHEEGRSKLERKDGAKDVLDALLSIYEDQNSEIKITRDNIKAFLVDMFTGISSMFFKYGSNATLAILTRKKNKNHLTPPSPPSLPIIGHFHLISELPHQSFHKLSTQYGSIMQLYLGSKLCVVLTCPEIIKEFLKTKETYFSNRFRGAAVHYLSYGSKGFLFAPYGNYWKFMKKKCMSELLGGKTIDQFCPLRQQETLRFLRVLQKKGEAGEAIDVGGELLTLTNRIITRMTMSKTFYENDSDEEDIRKMVQDSVELAGKFNVSDFIWFFKNWDLQGMNKRLLGIMDRFDTMMERVIKEHQEERKKRKENSELLMLWIYLIFCWKFKRMRAVR
ncbi:cytochrome P450 93A3 [Trifolium repens]|nr:cytochrome P450 93A3 [Trifolium repens]